MRYSYSTLRTIRKIEEVVWALALFAVGIVVPAILAYVTYRTLTAICER